MLWLKFAGPSRSVTAGQLDILLKPFESKALGDVYYKGRKDGDDYFERIRYMGGSRKFHVDSATSPVQQPFPFTADRKMWRSGNETGMRFMPNSAEVARQLNQN